MNRDEEANERIKKPNEKSKVRSRDIPVLLNMLTCGEPGAQAETLTRLCPCRNVRYDKEIWTAIFAAARGSESRIVRDKAQHAIGTLRKRARTDPRSQMLVNWLLEQGVAFEEMTDAVPQWKPYRPAEVNGIPIPRYERPSRSYKNRSHR